MKIAGRLVYRTIRINAPVIPKETLTEIFYRIIPPLRIENIFGLEKAPPRNRIMV